MRYISPIAYLELYSADGKSVKYKFNERGEYYGDKIDAYDETEKVFTLQVRGDGKDLSGLGIADTGFVPEEACGLGSLNGLNNSTITNNLPAGVAIVSGNTDLSFRKGLRGFFFAAPETTIVAGTEKLIVGKWEVVSGTFTYNGVTYLPGQTFVIKTEFTSGEANIGAVVKLMVPCLIDGECSCDDNKDEYFRIVHLMYKDDATNYYTYNSIGYKNPTDFYKHIKGR